MDKKYQELHFRSPHGDDLIITMRTFESIEFKPNCIVFTINNDEKDRIEMFLVCGYKLIFDQEN